MRTSELRPVLQSVCGEVDRQLSKEAGEALAELLAAVERFSDKPISDFTAQIRQLKPKRQRAPVPVGEIKLDLVQKYVDQLRKAFGDIRSTAEVMGRVRADRSVRRPEALAIAKALGVRTNSKTGKEQALGQAEGLSAQKERDLVTAERIRRGA